MSTNVPLPYVPSKQLEIDKLSAQIKKEEQLEAKCKKDADLIKLTVLTSHDEYKPSLQDKVVGYGDLLADKVCEEYHHIQKNRLEYKKEMEEQANAEYG